MMSSTVSGRGRFLFSFKDNYHDKNERRDVMLFFLFFLIPLLLILLFSSYLEHEGISSFNPHPVVQFGLCFLLFLPVFFGGAFVLFGGIYLLERLVLPRARKVKVYTRGIKILHRKGSWFKRFDCYLPFSKIVKMKEIGHQYLAVTLGKESSGYKVLRSPEYTEQVLGAYRDYKERRGLS